jgi:hypothetical protein
MPSQETTQPQGEQMVLPTTQQTAEQPVRQFTSFPSPILPYHPISQPWSFSGPHQPPHFHHKRRAANISLFSAQPKP